MKRLIVLFTVLALLLAGCGEEIPEADVSGKVEPTTEAATEAVTPAETPVSMGRMEGGTYTNEYAGYACDLDSSWIFYGAEELQELPDNVKELIADTEMADVIGDVPQFTDMMAENVDLMATVNALYQKHTMQERLGFTMLSDEELIDSTLEQQEMMKEAYTQAGMDVESMERVTVKFLGEDRVALRTVGTTAEIPFYMVQIFDYHLGQYSVTLTVNTYVEDNTQQVLDLFYPVS